MTGVQTCALPIYITSMRHDIVFRVVFVFDVGTTFYIDITTKVKTLPTTGPVFGSFKHQIDVFVIPIRLYIAALHNNALGVGIEHE